MPSLAVVVQPAGSVLHTWQQRRHSSTHHHNTKLPNTSSIHASAAAARTRNNQKMWQRYTVQYQLLKYTPLHAQAAVQHIMLKKSIQQCGGNSKRSKHIIIKAAQKTFYRASSHSVCLAALSHLLSSISTVYCGVHCLM